MKEKEYDIHLVFFEDLKEVTNIICLLLVTIAIDHGRSNQFLVSMADGGQLLKERICSPRSKFFPIREDLI